MTDRDLLVCPVCKVVRTDSVNMPGRTTSALALSHAFGHRYKEAYGESAHMCASSREVVRCYGCQVSLVPRNRLDLEQFVEDQYVQQILEHLRTCPKAMLERLAGRW